MPPAAAVGGAAALGLAGNLIQGNQANIAAQKQADAAKYASELQYKMYEQQRADQEPWRQAGMQSLAQLGNADFQRDFTMSDFQKDPGYDFRMQEGQKALERSAAARGGLMSGGTLKAIGRYGQDYASNEYGNAYNRFNSDRDRRFNRLSSIAGLGQTANAANANSGMNYANQVGQNSIGAANAMGAARMANASGWGNTLSSIGQMPMQLQTANWMQKWMDKNG